MRAGKPSGRSRPLRPLSISSTSFAPRQTSSMWPNTGMEKIFTATWCAFARAMAAKIPYRAPGAPAAAMGPASGIGVNLMSLARCTFQAINCLELAQSSWSRARKRLMHCRSCSMAVLPICIGWPVGQEAAKPGRNLTLSRCEAALSCFGPTAMASARL